MRHGLRGTDRQPCSDLSWQALVRIEAGGEAGAQDRFKGPDWKTLNVYLCWHCERWHLGSRRPRHG